MLPQLVKVAVRGCEGLKMGIRKDFCECGAYPKEIEGYLICPKSLFNKRHSYIPFSQRETKEKIGKYSGRTKKFKGGYENA